MAMDIGYELVMITVKYKYVDSLSGNQIWTPSVDITLIILVIWLIVCTITCM